MPAYGRCVDGPCFAMRAHGERDVCGARRAVEQVPFLCEREDLLALLRLLRCALFLEGGGMRLRARTVRREQQLVKTRDVGLGIPAPLRHVAPRSEDTVSVQATQPIGTHVQPAG